MSGARGLASTAGASGGTAIPQPPPRRGSRILLPAVLLLAFLGVILFAARDALTPREQVRIVPVVVRAGGTVSAGSVVATAAGWIEPDPYTVHVSALTSGVVDEVLVLEGESVDAGQVVARLVDDDARLAAEAATARVALAEAALRRAAADLRAAETDAENPVALERGAAVTAAHLAEARAERRRLDREQDVAEARIAQAEDERRRAEGAAASGAAPAGDAEQLRLRVATLRAEHAALEAREPVLDARVEAAEAEAEAARRDLELRVELQRALDGARARHDLAQAELDDARVALATARLRLERTAVRAPVAGVVLQRRADPGRRLMLDMDMEDSSWAVDLYDPARLQVRVDVPLADAAQVGAGQTARVRVETLPDRVFPGEVSRVVHFADIQKNTVEVKVRLLETDPALKPEMLARVEILGAEQGGDTRPAGSGRVFAPERLVRDGTAWVVGAGGDTAERRTVGVGGGRFEDWVEVTSGLQPGDRLIDAPAASLEDGTAIAIVGEVQ